jgi:serine/threonine protein phosphatase PrpC
MSDDHKPELPHEKARIERAGGFVHWNRVNGQLAMSRAFGDFIYKDTALADTDWLVVAYPDISVHRRSAEEDELLLLACDGVWDVVTNDEAVSFVSAHLQESPTDSALQCAERLIDWALKRESTDNISAIVVKFPASSKRRVHDHDHVDDLVHDHVDDHVDARVGVASSESAAKKARRS